MCIRDSIEAIDALGDTQGAEVERLDPLFATDEDFAEFKTRHDAEVVPKGKLEAVSYTHLDVYKRQVWRSERHRS